MNNNEARFILGAYRPGGHDATDPLVAEALAHAQRDPALHAWLEREQAFDAVVAAKLRAAVPPAGLREAILAGSRISRPRPGWVRPSWMALAAAVAVLLSVWGVWWTAGPRGGGVTSSEVLARFAEADVQGAHAGALHAEEVGRTGAWLQNPAHRLLAGIPLEAAEMRADRCRTVSVAGHEVFEICFQRGAWYHVYVAPRGRFAPSGPAGEPMFREQGTVASVSWADARHVYVLVTDAGLDALRQVL